MNEDEVDSMAEKFMRRNLMWPRLGQAERGQYWIHVEGSHPTTWLPSKREAVEHLLPFVVARDMEGA